MTGMRAFFLVLVAWLAAAVAPAIAQVRTVQPNEIPLTEQQTSDLRAKAEAGDVHAQDGMGDLYYDWAGVTPNYIEAVRWYAMAAAQNDDHATTRLKDISDFTARHAELYATAQSGDGAALYTFAYHQPHQATGLEGDAPTDHWLFMSGHAGYTQAQTDIGQSYFKAYYWRLSRAEQARLKTASPDDGLSDVDGTPLFDSVWLDFEGESLDTDLGNAIQWLDMAGDQGGAEAEHDLGLAYLIKGPTFDPKKASLWLHKAQAADPSTDVGACELDFTGSLHDMPLDYVNETPLVDYDGPPDYAAALACYDSVKASDSNAGYFLGYMYHHGLGTERDDTRALPFLTAAANTERYGPEAEYDLSRLYRDSSTIPHDPEKAYVALNLALAGYAKGAPTDGCGWSTPSERRQGDARIDAMDEMVFDLATLFRSLTHAQRVAGDAELRAKGQKPNHGDRLPDLVMPNVCVY